VAIQQVNKNCAGEELLDVLINAGAEPKAASSLLKNS
jgi:hypothetical protein